MKNIYLLLLVLFMATSALAPRDANATATQQNTVSVTASADLYANGGANMVVYADGNVIGSATVTALHSQNVWKTFVFTAQTAPKTVAVSYTNDMGGTFNGQQQDRNLYVRSIAVNGAAYQPSQAIYDRGSSSAAMSAWTQEGQVAMFWNGKLVFHIAPSTTSAAACGTTPSGTTLIKQVSQTQSSTAAATTQCPNGGTQGILTTVNQTYLCTNGTLTAQGNPTTTVANAGNPVCKAAQACVTDSGASTPSGSTLVKQVSQNQGSTTATATQCPNGGTQGTLTTVNQTYLCTNGTLTAQGNPTTTVANSGNPVCKAAQACGTTPSGSTLVKQVSQNQGSTTATATQCPYGGTQGTLTTVNQTYLCTNGTLTAQGNPTTTVANSGNPVCKAAQACVTDSGASTPSGSTLVKQVSQNQGSTTATATQCPNGGTQGTLTTVNQTYLCTNGTLTAQGNPTTTVANSGNPVCQAAQACVTDNGTSTPSGSTLVKQVSQTSASTAATPSQCPDGGTQATLTTVNQTYLCTNGVLTMQGKPTSTTTDSGAPVCVAPTTVSGSCGLADGGSAPAAPTSDLCATGTATKVSGTGPWTWSCTGTSGGAAATCSTDVESGTCIAGNKIPATASLILPPAVPQPAYAGDIVGVILQNTSSSTINSNFVTFGQIFIDGQVQPTDTLAVRVFGSIYQAQMDPEAYWPDGSVKLAAITVGMAQICSLQELPAMIVKAAPPATTTPVDPTTTSLGTLSIALKFSSGGTSQVIIPAGKLTTTTPDYWLHGPLATQARIDQLVTGTPTLHITADLTAYADGSTLADIQFNNDITAVNPSSSSQAGGNPALAPLAYTATVTLGGKTVTETVSQVQYADWHIVLSSNGTPPMLVAPSGALPALNIQHDLAYLEHSGAVLPYDRTTGVSNTGGAMTMIGNIISRTTNTTFGAPLVGNAITLYMPETGGRGDIGYTTQYNTVWLLTQDVRAAAVALAQSDTSGAIPWNFKLSNGHWLTPYDYPNVWTDNRGGPYSGSDGLMNVVDNSVWTPDLAHQPNLNYVPYIMTASRWNLDRLNAQAAFDLNFSWPGARCPAGACGTAGSFNDIVLDGISQPRGQAWNFREIKEASFIGKPGSFDQTYFNQVIADNWAFVKTLETTESAQEGEATGWIGPTYAGQVREWQQDYLTGMVVLASEMGDTNAQRYLAWQHPWLTGRFIDPNFNPYDGCAYIIIAADQTSLVPYTTWAQIEAENIATGQSNGPKNSGNWVNSQGDYCPLARAVLGGALTVYPGDAGLTQALKWLNASGAPYTDQASFQSDPTFNVVPLQ